MRVADPNMTRPPASSYRGSNVFDTVRQRIESGDFLSNVAPESIDTFPTAGLNQPPTDPRPVTGMLPFSSVGIPSEGFFGGSGNTTNLSPTVNYDNVGSSTQPPITLPAGFEVYNRPRPTYGRRSPFGNSLSGYGVNQMMGMGLGSMPYGYGRPFGYGMPSYRGGYGNPYGGMYGSMYGSPYGGMYGSPYGGMYGNPYGNSYGGMYGGMYGGGYGQPYSQQYGMNSATSGAYGVNYGSGTSSPYGGNTYNPSMSSFGNNVQF